MSGAVVQALVTGTGLWRARDWTVFKGVELTELELASPCALIAQSFVPVGYSAVDFEGLHTCLANVTMKQAKDIGTYLYSQPEAEGKDTNQPELEDEFVFLSGRRMTFSVSTKTCPGKFTEQR